MLKVQLCIRVVAEQDDADGQLQILGLFSKKYDIPFAPYPPTLLARRVDDVLFDFIVEQLADIEPGKTSSFVGGVTAYATHRENGTLSKERFDNDPSWQNVLKGHR